MCLFHSIYTVRPCLIHTCHAVPLTVYNVSFSFHLHSAAVSDSHLPCHAIPMPCPCQTLTMSFFSRPRHSTAVGLPISFRLLPTTTRSCTKIVIRSIPILLTTIHTYDCKSSTLQKKCMLNCWTSSSDISSYHVDFHEGHGTAGTWHGRGMACVN